MVMASTGGAPSVNNNSGGNPGNSAMPNAQAQAQAQAQQQRPPPQQQQPQPTPQSVGREFVRQYYTLLNQKPLHLHR